MKTQRNQSNLKSFTSFLLVVLFITSSVFAQAKTYGNINDPEPKLEFEEWMSDLNEFNANEEDILVVESWMSDLSEFIVNDEAEMQIEQWMTCLDNYHTIDLNSEFLLADNEPEMKVEKWMTNMQDFAKVDASAIKSIHSIQLENCSNPILIALKN